MKVQRSEYLSYTEKVLVPTYEFRTCCFDEKIFPVTLTCLPLFKSVKVPERSVGIGDFIFNLTVYVTFKRCNQTIFHSTNHGRYNVWSVSTKPKVPRHPVVTRIKSSFSGKSVNGRFRVSDEFKVQSTSLHLITVVSVDVLTFLNL